MIRDSIETAIAQALSQIGAEGVPFVVGRPAELKHGDYATNAALAAAKVLGQSPRDVADALVQRIRIEGFEKMEVAGAGFINFFLLRDSFTKNAEAAEHSPEWGKSAINAERTVMVEYTQPNPFKPFHIGHLMSNTIGESVARLLESSGASVIRANYQGDVGPHVAKALYVLLEKGATEPPVAEIGAAYAEGHRLYEHNEDAKKAIDDINKKVYARTDERVNALYDWGRKISLEHFEELYAMLGTKFDFYFFESETAPIGLRTVREHPEVFEESDGAIVFHAQKHDPKLHTRVFITSHGLPTYETKELGLAEMKKEKASFDVSLTVTAVEQADYFRVLFAAIDTLFPKWKGQFGHISHGMMRFASGKMSSRKGNVITGESLLHDLHDAVKEKMHDRQLADEDTIAQQVAVGAVKYAVLKQGSGKDIIFDPEKSLSLEGDSGPYLQYARTRAGSLVREATKAGIEANVSDAPETPNDLERILVHYPGAIARAARELEPHHVVTYLTELASAFNSWYANERVIGGPNPHYGTLLAGAVERTLRQGLQALGIPVPEEM